MKIFSLLEITKGLQRTLAEQYPQSVWIRAEMNKLNFYPQSGHCYPELLEKQEGKIVAQMKANLWNDDYQRINTSFLAILHEPLKNGINILFQAKVTFDPVYGLSLRILDIDPSYSLGNLEQERQKSIEKLKKMGIFEQNKNLEFPLLPKRIAVISVETSKGYADFQQVINQNPWKYRFCYHLFPSILQGEKLASSLIQQLKRIEQVKHHFDVVAIIRGGGGDIGLSGYNQFEIAEQIARFPLPVITGIGHATNETVVELVAFKNCITPTDLAGFLIQQFHNVAVPLQETWQKLAKVVDDRLSEEHQKQSEISSELKKNTLEQIARALQSLTFQVHQVKGYTRFLIRKHRELISSQFVLTKKKTRGFISTQWANIQIIENNIHLLDPKRILARGFSITLHNGQPLRSQSAVRRGDSLKTITFDGTIQSTVTNLQSDPTP
ncbi:MAG: exodeoxyribonuclease VII large subunit [Bacteroidales bacterium]|nr:exodeoxyribonuclease VII large subunit [Bacteroidales bacterium]